MIAAVYLRISTEPQEAKYGFDVQKDQTDAYAEKIGVKIAEYYRDIVSGTATTRLGLEELKRNAKRFNLVIIPRADRLSRDILVGPAVIKEFIDVGLQVHVADIGEFNPTDPSSVFLYAMHIAKAHVDYRTLTDNMTRGKLKKAQRGELVTPIRAYGYRDNEPYEPEAKWVRQIFEWRLQKGPWLIAKDLNALGVPPPGASKGPAKGKQNKGWYQGSINLITRNPVYMGRFEFGRGMICERCGRTQRAAKGSFRTDRPLTVLCRCGGTLKLERYAMSVPAIITPELYTRVNDTTRSKYRERARPGSRPEVFPLQGRIFCSVCDSIMSCHATGGEKYGHFYYYCRSSLKVKYVECTHRKYHRVEDVHDAVLGLLKQAMRDDTLLTDSLEVTQTSSPIDYDAERQGLEFELNNARRLVLKGLVTDDEYAQEKTRIEGALKLIPDKPPEKPVPTSKDLTVWRERVGSALEGNDLAGLFEAADVLVFMDQSHIKVRLR